MKHKDQKSNLVRSVQRQKQIRQRSASINRQICKQTAIIGLLDLSSLSAAIMYARAVQQAARAQ